MTLLAMVEALVFGERVFARSLVGRNRSPSKHGLFKLSLLLAGREIFYINFLMKSVYSCARFNIKSGAPFFQFTDI